MGCQQSEVIPMTINVASLDQRNSLPVQQPQVQQETNEFSSPAMQNRPVPVQASFPPPQPLPQGNNQPQRPSSKDNPKINIEKKIEEKKDTMKRHLAPRQHLEPNVNMDEDFLSHHLRYELTLTKLTSMKRIRRRQILEHQKLLTLWGNIGGVPELNINFNGYIQSIISSWIQRTFLDIWEVAHDDLFVKHMDAKIVRRKVAEQFMFQLYQIKEYVDSGMASINFMLQTTQTDLVLFTQASDQALFHLFKSLKKKYPQTGATQKIEFPDVPTTKTSANLLQHFPALSFSDPENMNYQTIYEDINFLLKKAVEQQDDFKSDMKDILGDDVLACPKVGQVNKDGRTSFNACAVRRVFVKWCQNLLQKCPDLQFTKTFMLFIKARSKIVGNFFFKSTVQPTTHKIVLDCISLILELAKFGLKDKKKRDEFIFNIYDLLRCKTKKATPEQIVTLLEKMKSTKVTKSGKSFEVLRVKNRFKTNNRDLLINFKYGDALVGEAQLCIDSASVSKQAKLNYEFCHYIYELERSLFGPTLELMMSYEDYQRPDITVDFEAQDLVTSRRDQAINNCGPIDRKCMHGHDMISLCGNFFVAGPDKEMTEQEVIAMEIPAVCNYCDRNSTVQDPYDYCYHCGCYLCKECREEYKKVDTKEFWLSIQRTDLLPQIKKMEQFKKQCKQNKSMIVLFALSGSSASDMFKDTIIYQQGKLMMQPGMYIPKIAYAKYSNSKDFSEFINKFKITDYPTLILFDQKAQPVKTVIGFSWFETPNLYMIQKRLIEGKGYADLSIKCAGCEQKMEIDQSGEQGDKLCLNCFGTAKAINLPSQLSQVMLVCSQGHYRCINCSYAALQIPSTYKDPMGGNYLSSNFVTPKLAKCPKGHQTVLSKKDPADKWEFLCFVCKKKRFCDNQHGIGECQKCKEYQCAQCLGAIRPSYKEIHSQNYPMLAKHYVQSTAEQGCLCVCQRHFKKAYCGRILRMEDIEYEDTKTWKCFLCQKEGQNGQLHIGCFACPVMSEATGQKYNFQICMKCAVKAKMLMRQPPARIGELPSLFKCPKDNKPLVHTTFAYKKKLVIQCHFCKKKYFGNTERFACLSCDLNCCKDCREHLWKGNVPKVPHACFNGHQLEFIFVKPNTLEFCDGCMSVLREQAFKCQEDDYVLCAQCVKMNPPDFVGIALKHLREAEDQDDEDQDEEDEFDIDNPFGGYDQLEGLQQIDIEDDDFGDYDQ